MISRILYFFFSYEGRIGRLQYFLGTVFLYTVLPILIKSSFKMLDGNLILFCFIYIFLGIINTYINMALVQKRCHDFNDTGTSYIISLLIGMLGFFLMIFGIISGVNGMILIAVMCMIVAFVCQCYLIFHKGDLYADMSKRSSLLKYPILFSIIVGGINSLPWLFLIIASGIANLAESFPMNYSTEKHKEAIIHEEAVGVVQELYANVILPIEVCAEEGVLINDDFSEKIMASMADELKIVDDALKKENLTKNQIINSIDVQKKEKLKMSVRNSMDDMRKQMSVSLVKEKYGLQGKDIQWSETFDSLITRKNICELMREGLEESVQEPDKYYPKLFQSVKESVLKIKLLQK